MKQVIIVNNNKKINNIIVDNEYGYIEYEYLYSIIEKDLYYNINNFINNDNYLLNIDKRNIKSDIDILLIKQILNYSKPFLNNYPNSILDKDKTNIQKNILNTYNIRNNFNILSYIKNNKNITKFNIPLNTEFILNGFNIDYKLNNFNLIQNNIIYEVCDIPYLTPTNELDKYYHIFNTIYKKNKNNIIKIDKNFNKTNLINIYDKILYNINFDEYNFYYLYNNYINNKNKDDISTLSLIYNNNNKKLYYNNIKIFNNKYNNKLIDKFNDLIDYKINYYYTDNIYNTLKNAKLHTLYEYSLVYGNDNKYIKDNLKNLEIINIEKKNQLINERIINNNKILNIQYENICKNKFPNLFNLNHKENIFNKDNLFKLSKLSKKHKDIIILEYKKKEKSRLEYLSNINSKPIEVLNLFRKTTDEELKRELFKQVISYIDYFKKKDIKNDNLQLPNTMLKCKNCTFDYICPHIYEYYYKLYSYDTYTINNTKVEYEINQKIISKYMSDAPIDLIYYCKICSEELGKSFYIEQFQEFVDKERVNKTSELDKIQIMILKNTYNIIAKFINLNNIFIKEKTLIYTIVDMVHVNINIIYENLLKSKMYTENDINNKITLHIIIYIYASLLHIIIMNPVIEFKPYIKNNIIINGKRELIKDINKKENNNLFIKNKFKEAFNLIIQSQNTLINNLKLQYTEIKQLLLQYYKILSINKNIIIDIKQQNYIFNNILDLLKISSIYDLIIYSNNIFPLQNNQIANNKYDFNNTQYLLNKQFINTKKINKDSYLLIMIIYLVT